MSARGALLDIRAETRLFGFHFLETNSIPTDEGRNRSVDLRIQPARLCVWRNSWLQSSWRPILPPALRPRPRARLVNVGGDGFETTLKTAIADAVAYVS